MSQPSAPDGRRRPSREAHGRSGFDDEGWGPSTAVYSGSAAQGGAASGGGAASPRVGRAFSSPARGRDDDWQSAGPLPGRDQRATRAADRRTERSVRALQESVGGRYPAAVRPAERGLTWWAALVLLVAIAALGGVVDTLGSIQVKGGFNIGIVVASVVAILAVKRSHMFPVVIAPPIVYSAAAVFQLYVRSSGLHDKKVIFDAAANYLVYGFPAIAAATAAVLIVAGIRLITRR